MNNGMVSNISNEAMSLKVSESQASHYNNDQKKMLNQMIKVEVAN